MIYWPASGKIYGLATSLGLEKLLIARIPISGSHTPNPIALVTLRDAGNSFDLNLIKFKKSPSNVNGMFALTQNPSTADFYICTYETIITTTGTVTVEANQCFQDPNITDKREWNISYFKEGARIILWKFATGHYKLWDPVTNNMGSMVSVGPVGGLSDPNYPNEDVSGPYNFGHQLTSYKGGNVFYTTLNGALFAFRIDQPAVRSWKKHTSYTGNNVVQVMCEHHTPNNTMVGLLVMTSASGAVFRF
jgi:hypothetical protein